MLLLLTTFAGAAAGRAQHVSWDIIHFTPGTGTVTFSPGGVASAQTQAPASTFGPVQTITLTGHGTFVAPSSGRGSGAATGGGTWTITEGGTTVASGTYEVRDLVSWEFANKQAGIPGTTIIDQTGDVDARANGTAVLRIEFSDGEWGILTVGCHGPGAPNHIFEGIATTKGYKTYYAVQNPAGGVDANRTIFHLQK
ncbi:MAG TPA: hypothetical protein VNJ46_07535 [Gaiellaceae bacterium]|nr:hypothetical protein [Gaiellaceae bacterium]